MMVMTDWSKCQFVSEHSTRIRSMNNEFEERSKKMKNEFETTLKEKNQVFIFRLYVWLCVGDGF